MVRAQALVNTVGVKSCLYPFLAELSHLSNRDISSNSVLTFLGKLNDPDM